MPDFIENHRAGKLRIVAAMGVQRLAALHRPRAGGDGRDSEDSDDGDGGIVVARACAQPGR